MLRILAYVRAVAFKIAVFVSLRDSRAFDHARRALFHPAVTRSRHCSRAVWTRDHLPSSAAAELAVVESHCNKAYGRAARTASHRACELMWMNLNRC